MPVSAAAPPAMICAGSSTATAPQFTTPSEEELLQHVELHTKVAHQRTEWTPELVEVVKTHVKQA
jgi:predicted small metal-binding protein